MKVGVIPERILERIALVLGLVPTPLADTSAMFILARTLIAATKLGIFESLAARPRSAIEVAALCDTNVAATNIMLDALVNSGYLRLTNDCYQLTNTSRKWVLKDSPVSLYDAILFADIEWNWMTHLDEFIRNGTPLDFHSTMTKDEWALYQRAMRSLAGIAAPEVARRLPVPQGAQDMLDIGGSHGYYSVALCRHHPRLRATVLDLPQAVTYAAPLLAKEGMGDRVVHWTGNALLEDFGVGSYDLILIAQLVHHFDKATNRELVMRASHALRPGGSLIILEALKPTSRIADSQLHGLLNLYFAFTSRSGTWSVEEISAWQRDAGLQTKKVIHFLKMPGIGAHVAVKTQ
jgi:SAM-dependent methyltransferase